MAEILEYFILSGRAINHSGLSLERHIGIGALPISLSALACDAAPGGIPVWLQPLYELPSGTRGECLMPVGTQRLLQ